MKKNLLKAFWNCGDGQIIEFALLRAHLNRMEKEVIEMMLDECLTQEEVAEKLNCSVRKVQIDWHNGSDKLLSIPWVKAYAKELDEPKGL